MGRAGKRIGLGFLALASCADSGGPKGCTSLDDPLAQIPVVQARLDDLSLSHTVAFVGPANGRATLLVLDDEGIEHAFDARLDGVDWGAAVKASAAITFGAPIPLELEPDTLTARELLGVYEGPVAGIDVGLGVTWRRLENDAGVVLVIAGLSAGLGIAPLAFEQLDLQLQDDPRQTP
jgi:hypothetical protein